MLHGAKCIEDSEHKKEGRERAVFKNLVYLENLKEDFFSPKD